MKIDPCLQSWWTKLWFWRDVVSDIPLQPGNFRILNPEILSRTWHVMQNYGKHESKVGLVACRYVLLNLKNISHQNSKIVSNAFHVCKLVGDLSLIFFFCHRSE